MNTQSLSTHADQPAILAAVRSGQPIVLLTGVHLCNNPRTVKEADALRAAGYPVEVLGAWSNDEQAERDREIMASRTWKFTPVNDVRRDATWSRARRAMVSLRTRMWRQAFVRFGRLHTDLLGYNARPMLRAARKRKGALFIAHSERGLWVACRLLSKGQRVGVDMEDWFSEDLLPEARRARPVAWLHDLEQQLLSHGVYRMCTSQAMSEALAATYRVPPPTVVYNVFPWSDRQSLDDKLKDRPDRSRVSLHWFSQTLGRGRGLEQLFEALPLVSQPIDLHLRGNMALDWQAAFDRLRSADARHRVFVHPTVSNDELPSRIAEHEIGFAGEQTYCQNRDLTVTNKLFQYLTSGLAVLASDTRGQQEIASLAPEAIQLYQAGNIRSLAEALNRWLNDASRLRRARDAALEAARERFCWEREAEQVVRAADAAIFGSTLTRQACASS